MTRLRQASSGISNSNGVTVAAWYRVVSHDVYTPAGATSWNADLLAWGYQSTHDADGGGRFAETYNHLFISRTASLGGPAAGKEFRLGLVASGPQHAPLGGFPYNNLNSVDAFWPPSGRFGAGAGGGAFATRTFTAFANTSQHDELGWHQAVAAIQIGNDPINYGAGTLTQTTKAGILWDGILYRANHQLSQIGGVGIFVPNDTDQDAGTFGDFQTTAPVDQSSNASFQIQNSGLEMAHPMLTASDKDQDNSYFAWQTPPVYNYNAVIDVALLQVWPQYIDPVASNRQFFYREENGLIYPVGGKIAAAEFGTPAVWFERDAVSDVKYQDNQGTAGVFTVVGTAPADLSEGPETGVPTS